MLADAFEVDAAYRYLFPDAERRHAGLEDFFTRNLCTHLPHRCSHVAVDAEDRVLGTVTLRPPHGFHISTLTMLRRGLLPFAIAHGRRAVERLLWLKRTYDGLEVEVAGGHAHGYVHMMAVRPDHQGRGIGSRLLAEVLAGDPHTATHPTVLTTHLPQNLVFYRRAGFELISERTMQPPAGASYPVWSMRRAV